MPRISAAACRAIPMTPTAAISRPRRTASWSAASICPTAIRRRAQVRLQAALVQAAVGSRQETLEQQRCPWCLPATTTSCRPTLTSISPSDGLTMRCSGRKVREAYRNLVAQGWTDAIRELHPDERVYTFWKYSAERLGARCGSAYRPFAAECPAAKRLVAAGVDRNVRARPGTSDHAPTWIELATQSPKRNASAPKTPKKA